MAKHDPNRLFVKDGFKHYRRSYSTTEAKWGFVVLGLLAAVAVYVGWRKDNPADPNLFAEAPLVNAKAVVVERGAPPRTGNPSYSDVAGGAASATAERDRGPVPEGLPANGWSEGSISTFTAENLYVKINGRADYFLSKGFERLYFVPLAKDDDESVTVDVEVYDMGAARNALGTFAGERREGEDADSGPAGLTFLARNALFVTRGPYYIRAIGSDESEAVKKQLRHLQSAFDDALAGDTLPWAYDFFALLDIDSSKIVYQGQNAFSLEFAQDVYIARPGGDLELFAVARDSAADADAMATEFIDGFSTIGEQAGKTRGAPLVKNEFIGTFATAFAADRFVLGVKGAANKADVGAQLDRLRDAFGKLGDDVKARAKSEPPPDTAGGYGAASGESESESESEGDGGEGDGGDSGQTDELDDSGTGDPGAAGDPYEGDDL